MQLEHANLGGAQVKLLFEVGSRQREVITHDVVGEIAEETLSSACIR